MTDTTSRLSSALADRYRIERELGTGGMATVYLAEDLKHDRKVAIKVLKPELAAVLGADRFVVEIKTTAALQHPHILPLFDSGTADGFLFYVMPYIQGETIRDKLNRETQFGVDDAVRIAREVADALDYAHRHGVIHRDIKPENLLLHDGRAMVMDFGIALAVSAAAGGRMTETGLSLGTPHYMSPEQATAEKEISPRSDVYSLASVLYEMLAGQPPHIGGAAQQVIMKIITEQALPVTTHRKNVPANVDAALAKALEKLPADRFATAREFGDALANPTFQTSRIVSHTSATRGGARQSGVPKIAFVAACVVAAAGLAASLWMWRARSGVSTGPAVPLTLELPHGNPDLLRFAVSPNGARFAFFTDEGIAVRDSGQREYRVLPGTQLGESPAFSPDGKWIAFQVRGRLRKIAVSGGSAVALIPGDSLFSGDAHWGHDGTIVFEARGGLYLLAPGSTVPRRLLGVEGALAPRLTADGRGVLYLDVSRGARLKYHDLAKDSSYAVMEDASNGQLLSDGTLVYSLIAGGVFAAHFDQTKHTVTGTPVLVVADLQPTGGYSPFFITDNGTLVYRAGVDPAARLLVRNPNGKLDTLPIPPQQFAYARYSPDGRKLALTVGSARTGSRYNSIYDLALGSLSQLTVQGGGHSPVWSPDGKRLAFTMEVPNTDAEDLFAQPIDKSTPPVLLVKLPSDQHASSWPTDTMLLFSSQNAPLTLGSRLATVAFGMPANVAIVNPSAPGKSRPYLEAQWSQTDAMVSPDGKWAAFVSAENGTAQIMVRSFPSVTEGGQWKISAKGGHRPRWSGDGRTIYYQTLDGKSIEAVHVTTAGGFTVGAREVVLSIPGVGGAFDVDWKSGKMVIALAAVEDAVRVVVVQNWLAGFERGRK